MSLFLSISLSLLANLIQLGGNPHVIEQDGAYEKIAVTDSATLEVYQGADSVFVVYTVCAPVCSSCARVYNKELEFLFPLQPPFTSVFPLATMDRKTGRIVWTDNNKWEYK